MNHPINIVHIIPNLRKGGAERLVIDIVSKLSKKDNVNIRLVLLENKIEFDVVNIKQFIHIVQSSIKLSFTKKNKFEIDTLQSFINDFRPNIIHTHLFEAEIISRSCYYPHARWYSHCHNNMVQFRNFDIKTLFNKKYLTNYYEKKYVFKSYQKNGGTHFIAISEDTNYYFEKNAKPYTVKLLQNAINYKRFYKNETSEKSDPTLKLINVGSFQDKKNQVFLLEVARILQTKYCLFEMHFLGDGANRNKLEQKIKEYQLGKFIFLHGNIENVEKFLWQSDIYIHSAANESFGLALLEAMAAGLPVITLDGKGNRDLIEQGKNGYMLFEEDAEKFADLIIELWNDKNKYQEISAYAQQFSKQFEMKNYCIKLLETYTSSHNSSI